MAQIEIDGKEVTAEPGSMIIEAADRVGIWIPRFCYHRKLSIAANCRMCLVDVEKSAKPLPACATPITDGMRVFTRSEKARYAQRAVMEFLLINHPLDCPICDQGGECELQDIAMGYGRAEGEFTEGKRSIKDQNLGPLIATEMTRCIQCTRCVRFGTEVAGMSELGALSRGEALHIGTFIEQNMNSEVSGNVIDLCPVGALLSKPFKFTARSWELDQRPSIAPHDCLGSHLYVHIRRDEVMRIVPRENENINEIWLSDRDRFSYEGLKHNRLDAPKIKQNGKWLEVSWEEALDYASQTIKNYIHNNGKTVGALMSPNSTLEEHYLAQKFVRALGSDNIDHRLRVRDFRNQNSMPAFPQLGLSLTEFEQQDQVLLIGADVRTEQPVLALRLRRMASAGKKISAINPINFNYNFELQQLVLAHGNDFIMVLADVLIELSKLVQKEVPLSLQKILEKRTPSSTTLALAETLAKGLGTGERISIVLGASALQHSNFSILWTVAEALQQMLGSTLGVLSEGANAAGAWLAGCVPHRKTSGQPIENPYFNAHETTWSEIQSMLLYNIDPELDCAGGSDAIHALRKIPFVLAITPYESETLADIAHVLLPLSPFTESAGTFVNVEGNWNSFRSIVRPRLGSRPGWKILSDLGIYSDLIRFEYNSSEEVHAEVSEVILKHQNLGSKPSSLDAYSIQNHDIQHWMNESLNRKQEGLTRLNTVPMYSIDNVVRRAPALQNTEQGKRAQTGTARVSIEDAESYSLNRNPFARFKMGDRSITLPIQIDPLIPKGVVVIPQAVSITQHLGALDEITSIEPLMERIE